MPRGARPPPQHPGAALRAPRLGGPPHTRRCDTASDQQLPPIRQARKVFSINEYN